MWNILYIHTNVFSNSFNSLIVDIKIEISVHLKAIQVPCRDFNSY